MKKVKFLMVASFSLLMVSCGGDAKKDDKKEKGKKEVKGEETKEEVETVPETVEVVMKDIDLSEHGYNVIVSVPEGVEFTKGKWDDALANGDKSFSLVVQKIDIDKAESLNNAKENTVNKFKSVIDENDNGYLIETEVMGKADFHIFYMVGEGDDRIVFENEKGLMPTKEGSVAMFNSLKNMQIK